MSLHVGSGMLFLHRRIFWSRKSPLQRTIYVCDILDGAKITEKQLLNADVMLDGDEAEGDTSEEGGGQPESNPLSGNAAESTPSSTKDGKRRKDRPKYDGDAMDGVEQEQAGLHVKGARSTAETGDRIAGNTSSSDSNIQGSDGTANRIAGSDAMEVDASLAGYKTKQRNGAGDAVNISPGRKNATSSDMESSGGGRRGKKRRRGVRWSEETGAYLGVVFRVTIMDEPHRVMMDSDLERLYRRIVDATEK